MRLVVELVLIPLTWVVAWHMIPWAAHPGRIGFSRYAVTLAVGCSGSVVALCI